MYCLDCKDKEEMDERGCRLLMKASSSARSVLNVPDVLLLSAGSSRSNGPPSVTGGRLQTTGSVREEEGGRGEVTRRNEGECIARRESVQEGAAMKEDLETGLETEKGN